jgi:hypothetical protein
MPFVPVPDTLQVELRMTYLEQQVENTLYFQGTPDAEGGTLIDLANEVLLWWNAEVRPYLSNQLTLREIYVTDLSAVDASAYTFTPPTPLPVGGDTAAALPGNISLAVSFRTAKRGRSFRGRNFIVGLVEPAVTGNNVSNDFANGMQDAYGALLSGSIAADWTWGVVSRYTNKLPRATGIFTPITAAIVTDTVVDSQRRRLPGRGR